MARAESPLSGGSRSEKPARARVGSSKSALWFGADPRADGRPQGTGISPTRRTVGPRGGAGTPGALRRRALGLETSAPCLAPSLAPARGAAAPPRCREEREVTRWAVAARLASLTRRTSRLPCSAETAHRAAIRGLPFFHATAFLAELPRQIKAAALKFRGRCGHRDAGRRTPGAASRILKGQRELALPAALLALLSEIRTSPFLTRGRGRWGARAGEQPPRPLAWPS